MSAAVTGALEGRAGDVRREGMSRPLGVVLGVLLLLAIDALVIVLARVLDPSPLIKLSHLVAVFIGAIQLLFGLPLVLALRRRRPSLAMGVGLGMVLVLVLNAVALYD